ncbi:unnamed protein product, partial [Nesidiocoris tenuis]
MAAFLPPGLRKYFFESSRQCTNRCNSLEKKLNFQSTHLRRTILGSPSSTTTGGFIGVKSTNERAKMEASSIVPDVIAKAPEGVLKVKEYITKFGDSLSESVPTVEHYKDGRISLFSLIL